MENEFEFKPEVIFDIEDCTRNPKNVIGQKAGICYGKYNLSDRRVEGVLANKHLACLRFAYATFTVKMSIGAGRQLVRHKFLDGVERDLDFGFLQQSTRYTNKSGFQYVVPESWKTANMEAEYINFMAISAELYDVAIKAKVPKEDARNVLTLGASTELAAVANYQARHDFLYGDAGRLDKAAQWEIRYIAEEIEKHLESIFPFGFGPNRIRGA